MDYPENIGIFTIINKIAETKKSIVFLGEDTRLKRLVAIKTLKPGLEEERTTQFIKEGQRLAMIETHPNLVQVYTSGVCENGQPFLVMQYVQGKTLEERLSEDPLNKKEAEKILKEHPEMEHLKKVREESADAQFYCTKNWINELK